MNGETAPATLAPPARPRLDESRGTFGMILFITGEATLFLVLFFAYFYLSRNEPRWPPDPPPELTLALVMLGLLVASSLVLFWGERVMARGREAAARLAVAGTILMGLVFVGIQVYEHSIRLETVAPTTNAYGSIFYTITGFHAAHLLLGLCMLAYVLVLPRIEHAERPPHRPLHNASLYWHFVDLVWVFIVAILYVTPHLVR